MSELLASEALEAADAGLGDGVRGCVVVGARDACEAASMPVAAPERGANA